MDQPDPTATRAPARVSPALATALPALLAFLIFVRATGHQFTHDDVSVITENTLLKSWSSLPALLREGYWLHTGNLYRPLTLLAFGVEWNLTGGQPWLTHLVNVVWHTVVTALVARLALRWTTPAGALAAATLFALHPVHVEAVADSVGRSELVCAAMLLVALLVATREGPWTRRRAWGVGIAAALALASKETGVTAPVLLWGVLWARERTRPIAWRAAGAAMAGVVPLLVLRVLVIGRLGGDNPHPAFSSATPEQHAFLVLSTLPRSLTTLLLPRLPRVDWSPSQATIEAPNLALVALGALLVLATLAAVVTHLRRPTIATTGLWLAAVPFAPTSNLFFPSGIVGAERTLYSPSIGVCLLLGALLGWAWAQWERRRAIAAVASLAALAWCLAAAWITVPEVGIWKNNQVLARTMVERSSGSYWVLHFAGQQARIRGDLPEAYRLSQAAVALYPHESNVLYSAAAGAIAEGDDERAVAWLRRALELQPKGRRLRTLTTGALLRTGRRAEAIATLEAGLRNEPDQRIWRRMVDSLRAAP